MNWERFFAPDFEHVWVVIPRRRRPICWLAGILVALAGIVYEVTR